jgi:glutathione S-transferase
MLQFEHVAPWTLIVADQARRGNQAALASRPRMKLYGTMTSPFVRRVRIVAQEVGAPCELINVATEEGQSQLRAVSPIWKMPAVEVDNTVILDSHVILDWLLENYGRRKLRAIDTANRWRETNIMTVIDGALDSAINVFYLKRDGEDVDRIQYMVKQKSRIDSAMAWLEKQLDGAYFTEDQRIGLSEIYLETALGWMTYRDAYPVSSHRAFTRFREAHAWIPSFATTLPST